MHYSTGDQTETMPRIWGESKGVNANSLHDGVQGLADIESARGPATLQSEGTDFNPYCKFHAIIQLKNNFIT